MKKFLKREVIKTTKHIKYTKICLGSFKKQSKRLYFQNKLTQYEKNITNTWNAMKAVVGKSKICNDKSPKRLDINKAKSLIKKL